MDCTTQAASSSQQSELSKPLLGLEQEFEYDEELAVTTTTEAVDEEEDFDVTSPTCCDNFILWMVLPCLLFVQFGIAFRLDAQQAAATGQHYYYAMNNLQWSTVNYSIVLFVVASYLFRRTLQEIHNFGSSSRQTFLFLLPEIIMDLLLALVLFGQVLPAFLTMVTCTMGLSLYVVVQSFRSLWEDDDFEEVEEEPQPVKA